MAQDLGLPGESDREAAAEPAAQRADELLSGPIAAVIFALGIDNQAACARVHSRDRGRGLTRRVRAAIEGPGAHGDPARAERRHQRRGELWFEDRPFGSLDEQRPDVRLGSGRRHRFRAGRAVDPQRCGAQRRGACAVQRRGAHAARPEQARGHEQDRQQGCRPECDQPPPHPAAVVRLRRLARVPLPSSTCSISVERLAHVDRQALQVGHRVAGAGEAEVERAGVADAGDVQRVAVHQQRQREQRVQARAVHVERLGRARARWRCRR